MALFTPKRPVIWGVRLGFHHGRGMSSPHIAKELAEGTTPETVRTMIKQARLPSPGKRKVLIQIVLESWERDVLQRVADERGIDIQTLIYRMVSSGLVIEDLYNAVTDGRYDDK